MGQLSFQQQLREIPLKTRNYSVLAALVARAYIRTFPNNSKNNSIILKLPRRIRIVGPRARHRRR